MLGSSSMKSMYMTQILFRYMRWIWTWIWTGSKTSPNVESTSSLSFLVLSIPQHPFSIFHPGWCNSLYSDRRVVSCMYVKTDYMGPTQCPHISKELMIVMSWLKPLLYRWVLATSLLAAFIGSGVLIVKPQLACIEKNHKNLVSF